jgi:hypothetical protein
VTHCYRAWTKHIDAKPEGYFEQKFADETKLDEIDGTKGLVAVNLPGQFKANSKRSAGQNPTDRLGKSKIYITQSNVKYKIRRLATTSTNFKQM